MNDLVRTTENMLAEMVHHLAELNIQKERSNALLASLLTVLAARSGKMTREDARTQGRRR